MIAHRSGIPFRRLSLVLAVVAFGGFFAITAAGDLFPLEQFGAEFHTVAGTETVKHVAAGSPADRAGLLVGDRILTVDGRPVRNPLDWATVFARVDTGLSLAVTIQRGDQVQTHHAFFQPRPGGAWGTAESTVVVLTRLAQMVTLIFAVALAVRATGPTALLGFWLLATIATYSVGLPPRLAVAWRAMPLPLAILFYVPAISKTLIGFILLTFFRALLNIRPSRSTRVLLAAPFVVFAVWHAIFLTALLDRPLMLPRLTGFLPIVIAGNLIYLVGALVMIGMHYRTLTDPSDRRRLRWVIAGSMCGCAAGAPTIAGMWLAVGGDSTVIYHSPLKLQLAYTAFLVMPVSFWWAIARGQLFDIQFVVRRGLQYVFARRALLFITPAVALVLALEAIVRHYEAPLEILRSHALVYSAAVAALLLFRSHRASWLARLDRRLFRERYDACQLLRDVAARVRTTRDLATAAEYAATQIDAALHPESVAVYTGGADEGVLRLLAGQAPDSSWPRRVRAMEEIDPPRRQWARLIVAAGSETAGADVIFVLGGKRSGEPYSREDRNLVQAVAESVGLLAVTIDGHRGEQANDESDRSGSPWDKRLWSLADAVARGSRIDWTKESTELVADERRQVLFELQALERLMQVHGAASDRSESAAHSVAGLDRWGDFQLREQIGAGRFGTVYRAWDPRLERDVAVKLLNVAGVDRAAYLREARHLARVRHPNVVQVYGADDLDDIPGFWMELVVGKNLGEEVRDRGPLAVEEVSATGSVLCRALAAVHRAGLLHQDVKAQNVMREHDGRLVLMDLGAGTTGQGRPTSGTPRYMAPELFNGGTASARTDIYSLGVLLFFLATGQFPIDGRSYEELARLHAAGPARMLRQLRPDSPAGFLDALDRALSSDPLQRFATAEEFATSLLVEVS